MDKQRRIRYSTLFNLPLGFYLAAIILIGFFVRTYVWHYSNWVGLVRHGDGYLYMAQALAEGNLEMYFSHWRFLQPVYPLYLAPMYLFRLHDSTYVFWLHQALAAGTILLIYFTARKFFSHGAGLLAALIYAIHLQIAYWINWAFSDIPFHFHLALFMYFSLCTWGRVTRSLLVGFFLSGMLLVLTRPDGFVIFFCSFAILVYRFLATRYNSLIMWASTLCAVLLIVGVTVITVFSNEPVRTRVLSNVHVGWGLYNGTLPTPTNPDSVNRNFILMFKEGSALSQLDPKKRNQWYWASQIGLERLKKDPVGVMGIMITRYVAVIIPSSFRDHPSFRYVTIDLIFSSFLILGTLGGLLFRNNMRTKIIGLTIVAFSIYTLVTIYQREWDVRVQLSAYTVLLGAASYGWMILLRKVILLTNKEI